MSLQQLILKEEYRSDEADVVREFYIPCLRECSLYRRAVGYFTSNSIQIAMQGINSLISCNGRMQLIASPHLTAEDISAMEAGYRAREDIVSEAIERAIPTPMDCPSDQWKCLAWLVAHQMLDIKIAITNTKNAAGIYHEKLGIFTDSFGNHIAFSGSANETAGGLLSNFETIDVFTSWKDQSRTDRKIANFEKLWSNKTPRLEILDFPNAAKKKVLLNTPDKPPLPPSPQYSNANSESKAFHLPANKPLRAYQTAAVANWLQNRGRGVLQMATGSGKTITGLAAAQRMHESGNLDVLVIVCPYQHLVLQWENECRNCGLSPILCFKSRDDWMPLAITALAAVTANAPAPVVFITTTSTFASEAFQSRIPYLPLKTMILADEVHNMGATTVRSILPESIPLRLGLSATPERWFDDEGTDALYGYFGTLLKPVFTLKDALSCKALCKYWYFPILIPLSDEEGREYRKLSTQIAQQYAGGKSDDDPRLNFLLLKRARLLATASGKEDALRSLMAKTPAFTHHLFYCGDGTIAQDDGTIQRHVDSVLHLLSNELKARVSRFTSETSIDERSEFLSAFASGDLQGLVAIRCLDEGVDIPSVKTAVILASSTNPRQFIQRRGRILRNSPGKTHASIYDMIVYPPTTEIPSEAERSLVRKELSRFVEFAGLAENSAQAKRALWKLQEHFHLTDL